MAGENSEQGTGTGEEGTGAGGGHGREGASGQGTGAPAAGPGSSAAIPLSVLPKELQALPESQIQVTLSRMVDALRNTNQENRTLKEQLQNMKPAQNAPGSATSSGVRPEEGGEPEKPLSDWLLEDPEKALDHFLNKKLGSQLQRLDTVESRVGQAELDSMAKELDDFADYRDDIQTLLKDSGVPVTRENIKGAYTMIVGQKTLEDRERMRRAANNPETARESQEAGKKEYSKTALSEEIRAGLGMSEDDYYDKYSSHDNYQIKVPT